MIGRDKKGASGNGIYRWVGKLGSMTPQQWKNVPGAAVRIAVGPGEGNAWVVNAQGGIYNYVNNRSWKRMPGAGKDIACGSSGVMWVIGTNKEGGGFGIYRYSATTKGYTKIPGSGVRITVDKAGNAIVANKAKQIYKYNGTKWVRSTGAALDIGVGAEGTTWVIGTAKAGRGGYTIYRRSEGAWRTLWATNVQQSFNWNKNQKYQLVMTQSGAGVRGTTDKVDQRAKWSWTWVQSTQKPSDRLVMQNDGNLVSYKGNTATWSTFIQEKAGK